MIKAVLFDFDGTLVDTSVAICMGYKHLFETFRPDYELKQEDYNSFLGPALKDVFPKYFKEDMTTLLYEYRKYSDEYINDTHIKLFPCVKEVIKELVQQNIKCGIVTSRQSYSARRILKMFGMDEYFETVIGCDDVKNVKPAADPYIKAMNELHVDSCEVIMVGDHPTDVKGSSLLDIFSIGVGWAAHSKEELITSGAHKIIDSITEILSIVKELK